MYCDATVLHGVVSEIWAASCLGDLPEPLHESVDTPDWHARVVIDGSQRAYVDVLASQSVVELLTAAMFDGDTSAEACADSLGEVCNQVAGGVKSFLSGECALHVPQVTTGDELPDIGREPSCTVTWNLLQGSLAVRVWVTPEEETA